MKFVLTDRVIAQGITEDDVKCMLRAVEIEELPIKFRVLDLELILRLARKASAAEAKRNRTVESWNNLINEFKSLT